MRPVRRVGLAGALVLGLVAASLPSLAAPAGAQPAPATADAPSDPPSDAPDSASNAAPAKPAPPDASTPKLAPGVATIASGPRGAPVNPEPVVVSQPDGAKVTIQRHGDGARHWSTTPDGAALAQGADGTWFYAEDTDQQGQLVPGVKRADAPGPAPKAAEGLAPIADAPQRVAAGAPSSGGDTSGEIGAFANDHRDTGTARTLVILASFSDHAGTTTAGYWNSLFFGATASVRDHYKVSSYNQLDIAPATEAFGSNDGIVGWVNLGFAHPALQDTSNSNSQPTVAAAIQAASPYVDYAQYDTDFNGEIETWELHVTVIMAGYEASYTGWQNCGSGAVWGHRWQIVSPPLVDGVRVGGNGFTTFGERHCSQTGVDDRGATMGIIAHEFGHDIGWPDLYDYDRSSEGVGAWSLMGGGSWNQTPGGLPGNSPALPDAFLKSEEGWVTPTKVTAANGVTVANASTTADVKQILDNPGGVDWGMNSAGVGEYFLVENRQQTSYDVGIPGCGLVIWHINETTLLNSNDAARLVDIEEADGLGDIDAKRNRGDTGDPYPGSSGNDRFAIDTTPNSRLNSGADSGVAVTILSTSCASTMTMNVGSSGGAAPANDTFAAATTVATGATVTGSNVGATLESNELAHASNRGGSSVWWKVTPAASGSMIVETTGSSFDTLLGVYQGAGLDALSYVAENDDAAGFGNQSRVGFNVTAGATYRIAVDGYRPQGGNAATGAVTLKSTFSAAPLGAPSNDQWASAATINPDPAASVTVSGQSFGATRQSGEPATHAGNAGGASVWWKVTAPAAGTLALDTRTSGFDSLLSVYTGTSVATLTPVAGNDDENASASILTSAVPEFAVSAGTTYYVVVDGYGADRGEVVLHSRYTSNAAPTVPTEPTGVTATYNAGEVQVSWTAPGSSGGSPITSYTVTASPGGALRTYTVGVDTDLRVAFSGLAPGTYTFLVRAVNGVGTGPPSAASSSAVVPDQAPPNDAFSGAVALVVGSPATGSTTRATLESGERPHGSNPGGASLWWKVVAPGSGTLTIDTMGSDFDTLLSVYTGADIDSLVGVAENDDSTGGNGRQSRVRIRPSGGTTYYIAVDGYRPLNNTPDTGTVSIRATFSGTVLAAPANDAFANAVAVSLVPGGTATATGESYGASKQSGEPLHAGLFGGSSVWWKITPPSSGSIALDTRGSGFDSAVAVYTGSSVSALTAVPNASNDDEDYGNGISTSEVPAFVVTGGTTYFIAVDGFQGTQGSIGLHIAYSSGDPGAWYHPVVPTRVLDSRPSGPNVGAYATPWGAGTQRDVTVAGVGGVPGNASAVVLNVTVTNTTGTSFLAVWPTGQAVPNPMVSSMNWTPGVTIPNAVTAKVGTNGRVRIYNAAGAADVIIDVVGWYGSASGDGYAAVAPTRVLDSRPGGPAVGPFTSPWGSGTQRDVTVAGVGGVPTNATAVVLNVTVTNTTGSSFLAVWPTGQSQPNPMVSSLNWSPGRTIPNAVTAKVGTSGRVRVYNAVGAADVIIDVAGYFVAGAGSTFHPLNPSRVLDSRPSGPAVGPYATPWDSGTQRAVTLGGTGGVPPNALAVVANVTITGSTGGSFLSVWPNGQPVPNPLVSSLNWVPGTTIANAVTTPLGSSGRVTVYNYSGQVHVITDVFGYFG